MIEITDADRKQYRQMGEYETARNFESAFLERDFLKSHTLFAKLVRIGYTDAELSSFLKVVMDYDQKKD